MKGFVSALAVIFFLLSVVGFQNWFVNRNNHSYAPNFVFFILAFLICVGYLYIQHLKLKKH